MATRPAAAAMLLALVLAVLLQSAAAYVTTNGSTILVDGQPFFVKGVNYSPSPIGVNPVLAPPYGDYFTAEYAPLWKRDFPLLTAMGANTVRVYAWNASADHTLFLDTLAEHKMYAIVSIWTGLEQWSPVRKEADREMLIAKFEANARQYAGHPALLAWLFGNEPNGIWNGYMAAFNEAGSCGWNDRTFPNDGSGCYGNPADIGPCAEPVHCVYENLFEFIDTAAERAHAAMGPYSHLVMTVLADVDLSIKRMADWEHAVPNLDVWGAQLFRGYTFGEGDHDFIRQFEHISKKPLLITEFGVDAYDDPCGRSPETPCFNNLRDPPLGFGENQRAQAEWDSHLASVLLDHSSAHGRGSAAGGCVLSWMDEQWKTAVSVSRCWSWVPYGQPGFDAGQCQFKAHVDCPNKDINQRSLCGFWMDYPFDKYVNEGYWGIMQVTKSPEPGQPDVLTPRLVYTSLQNLWINPYNITWQWLTMGVLGVGLIFVAVVACVKYRSRAKARGAFNNEAAPLLPRQA